MGSMNSQEPNYEPGLTVGRAFTTTHWSIVLAAGQQDSPHTDQALALLCQTYWHPLYAFIRRKGYQEHEAKDLTQEFFARLLEKNYLRAVDRNKGKFRSFLLAALDHFLANEWRNAHAQKRGGGVALISLNDDSAEQQYLQVPSPGLSPEQLFERQWALTLLEQVLKRLRDEFTAAAKGTFFDALKILLTGEKHTASYAEIGVKFNMTEAAVKMAVSRMRARYGELLRAEIANTVSRPEEVEEELRALFAVLSV